MQGHLGALLYLEQGERRLLFFADVMDGNDPQRPAVALGFADRNLYRESLPGLVQRQRLAISPFQRRRFGSALSWRRKASELYPVRVVAQAGHRLADDFGLTVAEHFHRAAAEGFDDTPIVVMMTRKVASTEIEYASALYWPRLARLSSSDTPIATISGNSSSAR